MSLIWIGRQVTGPLADRPSPNDPRLAARVGNEALFIDSDTGNQYLTNGQVWTPGGIPRLVGTIAGVSINGAGDVVGNFSFGSQIMSSSGSQPALAADAGTGSSPPAPVLVAGSNDTVGSITFGTGTAAIAGDVVTATFGTAYPTAPKAIVVSPANAATAAKGPLYVTWTNTAFTVGVTVAPAASQANTVYAFTYQIIA